MIIDEGRPILLISYSDLVSVPEAAAVAGLTTSGILNRIARGEIIAVRFSGRAFIVSALSARGFQIDRVAFERSVSELATVEQACRRLGLTDAYVLRLVRRGSLDGFQVNRRTWAITRESIDRNKNAYDPTSTTGPRRQPGLPGRRKPRKPRRSTARPESGARLIGPSDAAGAVIDARR